MLKTILLAIILSIINVPLSIRPDVAVHFGVEYQGHIHGIYAGSEWTGDMLPEPILVDQNVVLDVNFKKLYGPVTTLKAEWTCSSHGELVKLDGQIDKPEQFNRAIEIIQEVHPPAVNSTYAGYGSYLGTLFLIPVLNYDLEPQNS